jgi:hypothetical protein
MKVLETGVEWYEGYANDPKLKITVDKWPEDEDFEFKVLNREGSDLYWAQHSSGAVRFYCHNRSNEHGYAGSVFELKMDDGTTRKIRGPWSSRSGVMNNYFPHSVEVHVHEKSTGYNLACHMTIELAYEVAADAGVQLLKEYRRGDIVYNVVPFPDDLIRQHCGFNPESEES